MLSWRLVADSLVRDLINPNPLGRLEWLVKAFGIPKAVGERLTKKVDLFMKGGLPKYVLVVGYHLLKGEEFAGRPVTSRDPGEVLEWLHQRTKSAFSGSDTGKGQISVLEELGIRQDLEEYLREGLRLSFAPGGVIGLDPLPLYQKAKGKSPSKICSLCGRFSEHNMDIRTGVLGDSAQEFSPRPYRDRGEPPQDLRPLLRATPDPVPRALQGRVLPGAR